MKIKCAYCKTQWKADLFLYLHSYQLQILLIHCIKFTNIKLNKNSLEAMYWLFLHSLSEISE